MTLYIRRAAVGRVGVRIPHARHTLCCLDLFSLFGTVTEATPPHTVPKEAEGRHSGENGAARDARTRMVETAQIALMRDIVALAPGSLPGPLGRMVGKGNTETLTSLKTGAGGHRPWGGAQIRTPQTPPPG